MKPTRRRLLRSAGAAVTVLSFTRSSSALDYPTRPLRFLVGYPAGITADIIARLIAQSLSERLGQQVIVDNRPGAASNLATELVVRAAPDGYTLLVVTFANAINATLYKELSFDIRNDIVPVAGTFRSLLVVAVNLSFPANTVPEFIAYAKANPGKINYASAGHGTVNNVAAELFKAMAGVDLVHVPYRGNYLPDLLGGQVQVAFAPMPSVIEHVLAGKLRALAVTGATRSETLPGIPTVGEFVPGYEATVWHGIGAPKNTAPEIIDMLNVQINAALVDATTKQRFAKLGGAAIGGSAADFGKLLAAETEKWGNVIRLANIKPE
jgi:tripartite-type tricarboxylate transporter receptor subunit TctC